MSTSATVEMAAAAPFLSATGSVLSSSKSELAPLMAGEKRARLGPMLHTCDASTQEAVLYREGYIVSSRSVRAT